MTIAIPVQKRHTLRGIGETMPNRLIKESICRSEDIDNLSWFEEVLFYRLIVTCDDYGRFDGRDKIIRSACFPLKETSVDDVASGLKRLEELGMVQRYVVDGKQYIQLTSWDSHQRIRSKRSKYPGPNGECADTDTDDCELQTRDNELQTCDSKLQRKTAENPNPNPIRKGRARLSRRR
ncbi:MAG: hypothetical protein K5696_04985 [Lachnospiraceae bacterium]|nr:hypothetical protein [Lachnospiraceae bacterium]